mmetsp:Transcript_31418/g.69667  ORF Transcript_31418/g.69667 Transcript_31418/m.69667 type:complete len:186 (+) Transcript_31418:85-642(+)
MVAPKSGFCCFGPSFFSSAAFILSIFANARCNLVSISEDNPLDRLSVNNLGLWCYEESGSGYLWSTENIEGDAKFEASRGLGTATMALGFCVWLFYCFAGCFRFGPRAFQAAGLFCLICCILQSLVFLVFQSGVCAGGCGIGVGGQCGIAAAVLWFFASIFSCGVGKEVAAARKAEEPQDAQDAA